MTWYAIRTNPGAQVPQREYRVEETSLGADGRPRGKGYRIVPSLNPSMSAVERELHDAGFSFYMPAEYKVVRSRKKMGLYETRRFALLPGYLFVHDVQDWLLLNSLNGVAGAVAINGVPLAMGVLDIIALRSIEASSLSKAETDISRLHREENSASMKIAAKALAAAKRKLYPGQRVKILWGKEVGRQATIAGWTDDQKLRAIVDSLEVAETAVVPYDAVRLVAA